MQPLPCRNCQMGAQPGGDELVRAQFQVMRLLGSRHANIGLLWRQHTYDLGSGRDIAVSSCNVREDFLLQV